MNWKANVPIYRKIVQIGTFTFCLKNAVTPIFQGKLLKFSELVHKWEPGHLILAFNEIVTQEQHFGTTRRKYLILGYFKTTKKFLPVLGHTYASVS